jgi:hypothetical protein
MSKDERDRFDDSFNFSNNLDQINFNKQEYSDSKERKIIGIKNSNTKNSSTKKMNSSTKK